jgi:hypothetical protein
VFGSYFAAQEGSTSLFRITKMTGSNDAVGALATIVAAVAAGDLTPTEAAELSKVIDGYARTLQTAEFEERLAG